MSNDETTQAEPTEASLAEMPEVDFSRAIRPNKLAALRGDFKQAVFLDKDSRSFVRVHHHARREGAAHP